MYRKIIALFCLAAILLGASGVLSGCQRKATGTESDTGSEKESAVQTVDEGFDYENGDRLDASLYYGNRDFNIYAWNNTYTQEWVEELNENPSQVDRTLYSHVKDVESRLGLKIAFTFVNGNWNTMSDFLGTLESYLMVSDTAYDLVCQYSLTASAGAVKGLYRDVSGEGSNVDFEAPWWNDTLISGNTMNGKLYYLTGDLTPSVIYNMSACVFNKELLANRGIAEPYELVDSGNWTWDQLLSMIRNTSENVNREGVYTGPAEQVMYGLHIFKGAVDYMQTSSGLISVVKKDGKWSLSEDFVGTRTVDIVDKIRDIVWKNGDVFYDKDQKYVSNIFGDEKCLFTFIGLNYVEQFIRDKGLKVGVLPLPKYDADQENYYTRLGQTYSMFTVPSSVKDFGCSTAVLEALASDGYRNVTPVIFDKIFCSRYAADPVDARMFGIIKANILYDPGYTAKDLGVFGAIRNCVYNDSSWSTFLQNQITRYAEQIAVLNTMG